MAGVGAGLPSRFPAVKSEADWQLKRKAAESQQAAKRIRADENVQNDMLIEELLERNTRQLCGGGGAQPPAVQQGPTDFSGLFPKAPAQQQRGPQHRAALTFEDIAGGRAAQQQDRQPFGNLLGGDYLPGVQGVLAGEATNVTAAAGAGADRCLPASAAAPLDWSLKTTVRFSSPSPFAVAEEAGLLPAGSVVAAQRAFSACDAGAHAPLSMQQRYLAALHSWQFPADPWRQPAGGAAKLRGPPPEVLQRRADWQAAFASLYDALRCGACDAFYYISPEGTKKPCAVLFGAAGVGGRPRLHALLTRSTAGLRALLSGGMGLGFAAPLLPADADRRVELDKSAVPLDGTQSLLVFEGGLRVHGLFDFLLNESFRTHGDECDVPALLAPVQFQHASLKTFQPKVLGKSDARDPSRAQHRLELRAPALPPWVLDRLVLVLAVTQDGNFSMACDTHPTSLALNWCGPSSGSGAAAAPAAEEGGSRRASRRQPLGGRGGGGAAAGAAAAAAAAPLSDYDARQRGCWDAEEAGRWRAAAPGLSCNVVRSLQCEGGMFTAKLSAKSAERVVL